MPHKPELNESWLNYESQPGFRSALSAAAAYIHAAFETRVRLEDRSNIRDTQAFSTALKELFQHPMEFIGRDNRYRCARWMSCAYHPSLPAHGEHPWSKKQTWTLLDAPLCQAIRAGVARHTLLRHLEAILMTRQGTVLLRDGEQSYSGVARRRLEEEARFHFGVVASSTTFDGLHDRYWLARNLRGEPTPIVLLDRLTGRELGREDMLILDRQRQEVVENALQAFTADSR